LPRIFVQKCEKEMNIINIEAEMPALPLFGKYYAHIQAYCFPLEAADILSKFISFTELFGHSSYRGKSARTNCRLLAGFREKGRNGCGVCGTNRKRNAMRFFWRGNSRLW
jgi:hypothetical protein